MTHNEMAAHIGKGAHYPCNGITFLVRITDVKISYGRLRFEIVPESGSGKAWVESTSVTLMEV